MIQQMIVVKIGSESWCCHLWQMGVTPFGTISADRALPEEVLQDLRILEDLVKIKPAI